MMSEFLQVKSTDTSAELRLRLGKYLGMTGPLPEVVFLQAINDPFFAKKLLAARNQPRLVEALLKDSMSKDIKAPPSNLELIRKATAAFIKWGKSGFVIVDQETIEKREEACLACPHVGLSERFLQRMMGRKKLVGIPGKRLGASICKLCNCVLDKKIRLSTESCPDAHPELKGLNRWEEAIKGKGRSWRRR